MVIKTGMLVRVKTAKWIQKVFSIGILLSLIVGCSSGPSAEQKRNNYDACLIEMEEEFWDKLGGESTSISENEFRKKTVEGALKGKCVELLK